MTTADYHHEYQMKEEKYYPAKKVEKYSIPIGVKSGIPKKAQNIIGEWALEHQDELMRNWDLARNEGGLFRIPGADQT
jgi:hypothetical protein